MKLLVILAAGVGIFNSVRTVRYGHVMTEQEMIEVQLVPITTSDKTTLEEASYHLRTLLRLLGDDWEGAKTAKRLDDLHERISHYAERYTIPMPTSRFRNGEPLIERVHETDGA